MTAWELLQEPIWPFCAAAAWFVQMGVHEGMHAEVAYRLGDPTADFLGKRSVNPLAHIEWHNPMSLIASIVIPMVSVFVLGYWVPMGMAWVPVNIGNFRRPLRDRALVSLAGPMGNFMVCAVCLAIHYGVLIWLPQSRPVVAVETLCCAIYATSLVYGLFNLVPIPPLDGSRVVYWLGNLSLRRAYDSIEPFGLLIVFALFMGIPEASRGFFRIIGYALYYGYR